MAVRTVTVDLTLNATAYLATGRRVISINNDIDDSYTRITTGAMQAGAATSDLARDLAQMGRRARTAERRVHNLREEINRLIVAQAALRAGGPIPPLGAGGAARAGGRIGGGLLGMVINAFSSLPPQAQVAIGAGLVAAIAASSAAIGAAFGAAIVAGLGGVGLGAAIASASRDPEVRAAFGAFGKLVKDEFATYGDAFAVPLIRSAEMFGDRWMSISPQIRSMLADLSTVVEPLADGLAGMVENMLPGLRIGLQTAGPVLRELARDLPELGNAITDMFMLISSQGDGLVKGMHLIVLALAGAFRVLGLAIAVLANLWDRFTDGAERVSEKLAELTEGVPLLGGQLEKFAGFWRKLSGDTDGSVRAMGAAGDGFDGVTYKADSAAGALKRMTDATLASNDAFTNSVSSAIAYERAIDGLAESVKENGRSLDISSEKGRRNAEALLSVYDAARRTYDANIASGMSAQEAARKYNDQIAAANAAAKSAGMAADQVDRLSRELGSVPTSVNSTITVRTRYIEEGGPRYRPAPGLHVAQRDGGVHYARDGLMGLSGNAGIVTGGRPIYGFAEPGTGMEAFIARNAPASRSLAIANTAAGWHGGQVVPKGAGGNMTTVNLTVSAGMGVDGRKVGEQILQALRPAIAGKGGNVQVAVMGR